MLNLLGKIALIILLLTGTAYADTHTADSSSLADIRTAIAAATYGDTVAVPAGAATWNDGLLITKNIRLLGDSASQISAAYLNTNTSFDTDTDWTKGANWAISGGGATHSPGSTETLSQASAAPTVGNLYCIRFTVTGRTAGSVRYTFGGVTGVLRSSNATYTEEKTASSTAALALVPTSDFNGTITMCTVAPCLVKYTPDATTLADADAVFEFGNFKIDLNSSAYGWGLYNIDTGSYTKIKFHDNTITEMTMIYPLRYWGQFSGVVYNNTFSGYPHSDHYGSASGAWSWENLSPSLGSADTLYCEDNTFNIIGLTSSSAFGSAGQGGSWVYRYNDYINQSDWGFLPVMDNHGNHTASDFATMISEMYGNDIAMGPYGGHTKAVEYNEHRGGLGVRFGNRVSRETTATTAWFTVREEYADTVSVTTHACPEDTLHMYPGELCCSTNGLSQHVLGYYWCNFQDWDDAKIDVRIDATVVPATGGLVENVNFYDYNASYNGTTERGTGCGAALPENCTIGDGFWVTDQSCSDIDAMVGVDPATPIDGVLYQCTAEDTWTEFYIPYTYPHPLRQETKLSGTLVGDLGLTESEIVAGGKTIIGTVFNTTLVATFGADNAITTAFIAGITSDGEEVHGFNNEVAITHADITRNSDTQFTIVLPAAAGYDITAAETLSMAIPASSTASGEIINASPAITIDYETVIPIGQIQGITVRGGNTKAKGGAKGTSSATIITNP